MASRIDLISEIQREERNAALREMAEGKIKFLASQSSKLCSGSFSKFKKLMFVFSNTPRIKSDNIIKAIDELTKLEAEVSVKIELQVAETQVKTAGSLIVRPNIMLPQLTEQSESNTGIRYGHSQISAAPASSHQRSETTTYSKSHTIDDTLNHEISLMASSYQPQPIETSLIHEERLALKYPRKKKIPEVQSTVSSPVCKTPEVPEKRGDDKLFFRRAEVFPAPAQTYLEHKMRIGSSSIPLLGVKSKSTSAIPISDHLKHGVTMRNNAPQPLSKPNVQHASSSAESCDSLKMSTSSTENKLPTSSDNLVELSNNAVGEVSPPKKGQKPPSRELHSLIVGQIEFVEFLNRKKENERLRNISNYMESVENRQKAEEWSREQLKQHGMENETRVLLTRLEDDNGIALRTRSKSTENRQFSCSDSSNTINQNKKSPSTNGRICMRRKTVDCREALENLSQKNKNREPAKSRKSKLRRKSHCGDVNSSLYLSDNEDNNYEPPTKKKDMNNRKSKSNRDTGKKQSNANTKSKKKASSTTRENSGAKTSVSPQENSKVDKHVDIPNDNSDVHCQSNFMSRCSLCPYRGGEMVDHYLTKHKQNEVCVSRLSPRQSDIIRKFPIPLDATEKNVSKNELNRLTRFCCFCEKNCVLTYKEWIEHIAQHTGEYEYDQAVKTLKKPFVEIKFQNNNILGYICDRCNYVQTRLSAMENHLEKQHCSSEDGPAKTTEYIRFAMCRAKVESSSVENKTNLKLKPEPIFGCQVINNPIDKDEESMISDEMDHDILHELERLHGYEPLIDSIVKEEIDLNSDAEYIHQCGQSGTKPAGIALHSSTNTNISNNIVSDCTTVHRVPALQTTLNESAIGTNEITRERHGSELAAVRDDAMDYDSDDSLNTIAMDDPDYQHSMGGIKEEEFAEEFRKSGRDNPSQSDKNNQGFNVVPSINDSLSTENGNGPRKNGQNIIDLSCVKAEIQEAECGVNEENQFYNNSNEIRNKSLTDSTAKQITCTTVRSNTAGSDESTNIQEKRAGASNADGNVDAMAKQTTTNSNRFEIVRDGEQLQYLCFYSTNCKFMGSNAISLEKHVQTKHSVERWSGYCHLCTATIENNSGLSKQFAIHHLKHFLSKHSDSKPAGKIRKPLKIRLRRLSGDKLSVVNN
uniref:C2H2-type domain-containing protein n=1 Tax=Anopheles marajoara TaxID=58244 RepID=A0A2M4BAU2_9DIPT